MVPRTPVGPPVRALRTTFLPFAVPTTGDEEAAAAADALRSGWITTGPRARAFEEAFAAFVGAPSAIALNSCSAGLHAGLHALGMARGDAVITTPLTFAATAHAIEHAGAETVFADVDPVTLTLSPDAAEAAIASARRRGLRPAAILPVHFAGQPADVAALEDLAAAHGMALVEDAAHALPARHADGRAVGAPSARVPSFVSFSFYANKNLTTGDGGMLTGTPSLLPAARVFCDHGTVRTEGVRSAGGRYEVVDAGFKYGMTDVAAAVGLVQLRRLAAFDERRRALAAHYGAQLAGEDGLELPSELPGTRHAWHLYAVRLPLERLRISRDRFVDELAARNVGASVHFVPLPSHPWFRARGHRVDDQPVARREAARLVSLPLHPGLTDDDADDVIAAVADVLRAFRR